MADELWYVGNLANVKAIIKDAVTKGLVDPDSVTLTVTKPLGATETRTFIRDSLGEYHTSAPVRFTEEGFWKFVVSTTGTYEGVKPVTINVHAV